MVVEDFHSFRRFVCSELEQMPELRVICEVSDGQEAVHEARELRPDLILLDIGVPTLNGIEAARRIRLLVPESKIAKKPLLTSFKKRCEWVRGAMSLKHIPL
jgi:DNA-binding NarL/FixJ family response regulator